jgi:FkbM family methyltransferase
LRLLWKPWFVYQPTRLLRRAVAGIVPPPRGYAPLETSWGVPIIADPTRTIGRSIVTTGVYDLAVSETLARLISPGDTVVDAGANVGYMTVLASVVAGPKGRVLSFEPHPALFAVAERNVRMTGQRFDIAKTDVYPRALGHQCGSAQLIVPPDFDGNDGISKIAQGSLADGESITVPLDTLDEVLESTSVALLKLDVEGFEAQVLRGAARSLSGRRIRHIVFEDHEVTRSEAVRLLSEYGYRLYSLGWALRGLRVQPVENGGLAAKYEAPNFIATLEPEDMLARCRPTGWRVLDARFVERYADAAREGHAMMETSTAS